MANPPTGGWAFEFRRNRGALGLSVGWVLHDVVEWLTRVERSCEARIASAEQGNAEPGRPGG